MLEVVIDRLGMEFKSEDLPETTQLRALAMAECAKGENAA